MAHYGRYLFHFQNVTFNATFGKVTFCRQEYPAFSPSLSATIAGHFGRAGGHPRASGGVFRVPLDGKVLTDRARRFPVCFSFWLPSGSVVSCPCPAVPGQWSAAPSRTLPADRFPVHGSRFRVSCVGLCQSATCPALPRIRKH